MQQRDDVMRAGLSGVPTDSIRIAEGWNVDMPRRGTKYEITEAQEDGGLVGPSITQHDYRIVSTVLGGVCVMLLGLVGWLGSRAFNQLDILANRVSALETSNAVTVQNSVALRNELSDVSRKLDRLLYQSVGLDIMVERDRKVGGR